METGAHWAEPADFPELKRLGFQFTAVSLDNDPAHWKHVFDAAERSGIRLIAGLHPYPYRLGDGDAWTIEPIGRRFIEYAASRESLVKALYVFNEPYWVNPATGHTDPCGAVSADQLRGLSAAIHAVWPQALLYHDLGRPSQWAPGGGMQLANGCIGRRYADVTRIADYAGIWFHPVSATEDYRRERLVESMRDEIAYVTREMRAEPIVLGQAFGCDRCSEGSRLPTAEELRDINCTVRWLAPQALSWYPWRQPAYHDALGGHRELWKSATPGVCALQR